MENKENIQYVDVEVTRKKFKKELEEFKELELEYRKRGVFLIENSEFKLRFLFSIPILIPSPIAFSVELDYTNWDFEPPSLILTNPFTGKALKSNEVGIQFLQWNNEAGKPQPLLVGLDIPFLCIPGIREYHNHQHHSGDSWFLYRNMGEGKLCDLIEKLIKHSVALINGYSVKINEYMILIPNIPINYDSQKIPR